MSDDALLEPFRDLTTRGDGGPWVVVEGAECVRRLLTSQWPVEAVLATGSQADGLADALAARGDDCVVQVVAPEVLREVTGFDFHRGCLAASPRTAVPRLLDASVLTRLRAQGGVVLVADGLADPRNVGALVRTARALGADAVLVGERGADPFSRRAVRASMGHVFHLPLVVAADLPGEVRRVRAAAAARVVAAARREDARGPAALSDAQGVTVLVVGHEGHGVGRDLLALADDVVAIPMADDVDSLNVVVAAGILLQALRH